MTLHRINGGTELYNPSAAETTYRSVRIQVKSKVYQITISEGRYNNFFCKIRKRKQIRWQILCYFERSN
jgi:hypothetical protein